MEQWFDKAVSQPWAFIALGIIFFGWKAAKYLGRKLFDDDKGLLPNFLNGIREDSGEMKSRLAETSAESTKSLNVLNDSLTVGLADNRRAVTALERQLVSAIQAKPDDNELFDVLFTNNPIPICFVGQSYKFTRINKSCEEFFGYSAGELAEKEFSEITLGDDIPGDIDNVERVAHGSITRYRMEKTYVRKDGTHVNAVLYVFRYPVQGAFLHFISIIIPL